MLRQRHTDRALLVKRAEDGEKRAKELEEKLVAETQKLEAESKSRKESEEVLKAAQWAERRSRRELSAALQKALSTLEKNLTGCGVIANPPSAEGSLLTAVEWLSGQLESFGDLADLGHEFVGLEATRALMKTLRDAGCTHADGLEAGSPRSYWPIDDGAHQSAVKFFDSFWRPGGRNLTLYREALSDPNLVRFG